MNSTDIAVGRENAAASPEDSADWQFAPLVVDRRNDSSPPSAKIRERTFRGLCGRPVAVQLRPAADRPRDRSPAAANTGRFGAHYGGMVLHRRPTVWEFLNDLLGR